MVAGVVAGSLGAMAPPPAASGRALPGGIEVVDHLDADRAAAVTALLSGLRAAGVPTVNDGHADALEDLRAGRDGAVACLVGADPLTAYGQLVRTPAGWEVAVVPTGAAAAADILAALAGAAAARGGGPMRWWVAGATGDSDRLAAAAGMTAERTLLQLRCPLPLPAGTAGSGPVPATRPFDPDRDVPGWLACNNRAFAGHPEQGGWDEATFARRRAASWFDPGDLLVAEEGGRIIGSCWTKLHPGPPVAGEIYVIGVDPSAQGRGLGRGLTVAGLAHLVDRGATEGLLYVDASNAAALALYASLGFVEHRRDRCYLMDVVGEDGQRATTARS